jgi:hypothetical protein
MEMNQATLSHLSSVRYCDNVVWVSQQSGKGHILYLVHDKTYFTIYRILRSSLVPRPHSNSIGDKAIQIFVSIWMCYLELALQSAQNDPMKKLGGRILYTWAALIKIANYNYCPR